MNALSIALAFKLSAAALLLAIGVVSAGIHGVSDPGASAAPGTAAERVPEGPLPPLDNSNAIVQEEDDIPPLPPFEALFFDQEGHLTPPADVDDRNLPPEEKAANPLIDPAWNDFLACMADSGYDVRPDVVDETAVEATYGDVMNVYDLVESYGPSPADHSGPVAQVTPHMHAQAYVDCHLEHLGLP